jgi:hypothetical protein
MPRIERMSVFWATIDVINAAYRARAQAGATNEFHALEARVFLESQLALRDTLWDSYSRSIPRLATLGAIVSQ